MLNELLSPELVSQFGGVLSFNVILAGILFYAKDLIFSMFNRLYNGIFYSVTISDDDLLMSSLVKYIEQENLLFFRRNFQIGNMGIRLRDEVKRDNMLSFSYGSHFGFFKRLPFTMTARLHESEGNGGYQSRPYTEITLSTAYPFKFIINLLMEIIKKESINEKDWTYVKKDGSTHSFYVPKSKHSGLVSVILPEEVANDVYNDIQKFWEAESYYHQLGIQYKRIYLLYGVPGSGKSSLARAVAREYGLDFYVYDLSSKEVEYDLLETTTEKRVMLFEDIDSVYNGRVPINKKKQPVSFELLLNVLDGNYVNLNNTIVFITVNDIDKVDKVLMRPGRMDRKIEFKLPTHTQKIRLCDKFGIEYDDVRYGVVESMSELQELLIEERFENDRI